MHSIQGKVFLTLVSSRKTHLVFFVLFCFVLLLLVRKVPEVSFEQPIKHLCWELVFFLLLSNCKICAPKMICLIC